MREGWRQGEDQFSIYVEDEQGRIIADVRAPRELLGEPTAELMERHRARARVMAAAPKMLKALKDLVDSSGYQTTDHNCDCGEFEELGRCDHSRAKAAIAEAEGRT